MKPVITDNLNRNLKTYLVLSDIAEQIGSSGLNVVDSHSSEILHKIARGASEAEVSASVKKLAEDLSDVHQKSEYSDPHIQTVHAEELQKILF